MDGQIRRGGDRVRRIDPTCLSRDSAVVWIRHDAGPARVLLGGRRDHNDRPPHCRWGALRLDETHEACRGLDGEPGTQQNPEIAQAFPGIRGGVDLRAPTTVDLRGWRAKLRLYWTAACGQVLSRSDPLMRPCRHDPLRRLRR